MIKAAGRVVIVLVSAAIAWTATACDSSAVEASCASGTFDLNGREEPLGSSSRLIVELAAAVERRTASISMRQLSEYAGWVGAWDRAIYVGASTTVQKINDNAGTGLGENCVRGIPGAAGSDGSYMGYLVFVEGGRLVQAVGWNESGSDVRFKFGTRFITPDTLLSYVEASDAMTTN